MATTMENLIAVLVIIAIITSASGLFYATSIISDVGTLTDTVASLAGSVADLTTSVADVATSVADLTTATVQDLADIAVDLASITGDLADIADRVTEIEGTLSPTITVVGPWSGAEMDIFLPVLERFEVLSGINVKYRILRAEDLITTLPAQLSAGVAPGDVIFMWPWFIKQQGPLGHALDVTDLIDETEFLTGVYDPVKVDDTIYGGSYTMKGKPGFWYRKSFFAEHGLSEPTTWAEFTDLLEDISAIPGIVNPIVSGDGVGWPLSDVVDHFLITYGGPQLQRDLISGTAAWTSPEVRSVFADYLVPLLEADYFSTPLEWTTGVDLWWDGDYGLYFMGGWITGMGTETSGPKSNTTDIGLFALPDSTGLVFVTDYAFIPTYTKYPNEAKELFKFLASEEAQRLQVTFGGHVATSNKVTIDAYPPLDAMIAGLTTGKEVLLDLDDTVGGEFQSTFWDQLKLLWVDPTALDDVLAALEAVAP